MDDSIISASADSIDQRPTRSQWTVTKDAVHALHATPVAILLTFLLFAPMVTQNVLPEIAVLLDKKQAATGVASPGLAVLLSLNHVFYRAALPMLVLAWIAGMPWIAGGTAGRFLDRLDSAPVTHSFSAHAKHMYGRAFVIMLLAGVPMVLLVVCRSLVHEAMHNATDPAVYSEYRPEMLAATVMFMVLDSSVLLLTWLAVAAAAWEERGVIAAVKSSFLFATHNPKTSVWLLSCIVIVRELSMFPVLPIQQSIREQEAALATFTMTLASLAWAVYTMLLSLSLAVTFYRERRPRVVGV